MQSSRRHSRRFSALDLVILTASTVVGLVWTWLTGAISYDLPDYFTQGSFQRFYLHSLPTVASVADPSLAALTLAWCVLRLRSPRPRWCRLVRQPGAAVGFVAILAWLAGSLVTLRWGADVHHGTPSWVCLGYVHFASATMLGGFGVFVTWLGSALSGRLKSEGGWVDWMGQALGVGWIALGVPSGILLRTITAPFY